jgi:hypothetical protein
MGSCILRVYFDSDAAAMVMSSFLSSIVAAPHAVALPLLFACAPTPLSAVE